MKKILPVLTIISFLAAMVTPIATSAQKEPVKCIKLGADVKWTTNIGTFNCASDTKKYCLFKAGKAVGEEIKNGQCGATADITTKCDDIETMPVVPDGPPNPPVAWADKTSYWEQSENCLTNTWGLIAFLNGVSVVTNWLFVIIMVVVILLVAWGAYDILTAAGGPEKIKAGRDRIIYAMVGLAVALLAKAIPLLVSALLRV